MRGIKIIGGLCMTVLLLSGCHAQLSENHQIIDHSNGENIKKEKYTGEYVEMTPEQKALILKVSVTPKDVEQGKLANWERKLLRQYDYALEVLHQKYPSYEFYIVGASPKRISDVYATFDFKEQGSEDVIYTLYVYEEEDDVYSATDNFYASIITQPMEDAMKTLLLDEGIPCDDVDIDISTTEGEAFNEAMKIEDIMTGKITMTQLTRIYIKQGDLLNEDYESLFNTIKQLIETNKIAGGYSVIIYEDNNKQDIYKNYFSVFV